MTPAWNPVIETGNTLTGLRGNTIGAVKHHPLFRVAFKPGHLVRVHQLFPLRAFVPPTPLACLHRALWTPTPHSRNLSEDSAIDNVTIMKIRTNQ